MAYVAEAVRDTFDIPVKVIPIGNDMGRVTIMRTGMADLVLMGGSAYFAREGLLEFCSRAWGPQRLRMGYLFTGAGTACNACITTGETGIKTLADLKGKKIPFVVGLAGHNIEVEAALAFANLTWDDVIKVELPSYASSVDALLTGKTDIYYAGSTSSSTVKVAAAPGGIVYLQQPREDTEGWLRYNTVSPVSIPSTATLGGPGITPETPWHGAISPQPYEAYDFHDDDLVYFETKVIAESYPAYKDKTERLSAGDLDSVLDTPGIVRYPWHPGAIRYFKEVGKWTSEMETWNNKILEREEKLLEAWDTCLAEMAAKEMKESELPALWSTYQKNIPMVQQ